jgi:hypothetical protein
MPRFLVIAPGVVGAVLLSAPPAAARIVPVFDAREQLAAAEAVVRGRIVDLRDLGPASDPYGGGPARRMLAAVTVDVVVKGPVAPGPLSIALLTNPPAALVIDGLPIYTKGETYVFFLKRGPEHWELVHPDIGARAAAATAARPDAALTDPTARLLAVYAASLPGADYAVAIEALDGLGALGGPVAAAAARGATTAPNADVRAHAFAACIRAGDMDVLPEAVRFVETADPKVHFSGQPQHWVRVAIGAYAGGAALTTLHGLLRHRDEPLRLEVARALRRLRLKASVFFLAHALDDRSREVRYVIVQALAEILGKSGDYAPAMGDAAREDRATALWKKWWETEGKTRFSTKVY